MLRINLESGVINTDYQTELNWLEKNTYPQVIGKNKCVYAPEYLKHIFNNLLFKHSSYILVDGQ